MRWRGVLACAAAALLAALPAAAEPEATQVFGAAQAARELRLRGTTDLALFERLLAGFAATQPGLRIVYEQWGSNELHAVAAAECREGRPGADMLVSSAVDLQVALVNDGCARPYRSDLTATLPDALNWRDELFGITREPAVMIYNRALVPDAEAPRSRFDLIDLLRPDDSRYRGRVATYDIEQSGLGYLFAFLDARQATTFGSLIEAFDRAEAVATCCSAELIEAVVRGDYLVAYNVLGSYALARAETEPNLVVVAPADYTLVLARAAMIPRAAPEPVLAAAFLDYMLSTTGRQAMAAEHLIVDLAETDGGAFHVPPETPSALRQVALSPVLLVGRDRQKRELFLARWRETFRRH